MSKTITLSDEQAATLEEQWRNQAWRQEDHAIDAERDADFYLLKSNERAGHAKLQRGYADAAKARYEEAFGPLPERPVDHTTQQRAANAFAGLQSSTGANSCQALNAEGAA